VLRSLATTEDEALLLAVSTLRGELADNNEWKADPARPAIIIGTIDMIGSKLLFSGYGDGRYWRAQHAGLVGQDSLIVHDEAHLEPAFSDLLHELAAVQRQDEEPRPVQVMELSATSRSGKGPVLTLEPQDERDDVVRERLDATKHLYLHEIKAGHDAKRAEVAKQKLSKLVELSKAHDDDQAKVLIYVRLPEQAQQVVAQLSIALGDGAKERIALLTGTMRGHERDRLVQTNPVYRAFLDPDAHFDRTVYLVSTSAGEVGIDLDADHMVCDLTSLDSLIQRLGRVNRRGGRGRKARVDVVVQVGETGTKNSQSNNVEEAIRATHAILHDWKSRLDGPIDVSPRNLRALLDGLDAECIEKAFAPRPRTLPLTDVLLDWWSLTSVNKPMLGRPNVADYLHGLTRDPPETYVIWRKEVTRLAKADVDAETLSHWFDACRIEPRECLRDRTDRVRKILDALLAKKRVGGQDCDFPVVLLNERGEAEAQFLSHILEPDFNLAYRTLVLPVEAGGLSAEGILDASALEEARDVAEAANSAEGGARRERWLLIRDADGEQFQRLMNGEYAKSLPRDLTERDRVILQPSPEGAEDREYGSYLLALTQARQSAIDDAQSVKTNQTLAAHTRQTVDQVQRIAQSLDLQEELKEALVKAAERHDRGKARHIWQWYAQNHDSGEPLAKSTKYRDGRVLGGYRHEFGSLLEASAEEELRKHPESELILHLIAAHHGWARPHFERNACDNTRTTSENEAAGVEAMQRFGRLQRRFGRWGLAWLEALVRCADIAASKPDAHWPVEVSQRVETET